MPRSIALAMKEAKEEGSFEKPEDQSKKSKRCEGSPSHFFAERNVCPGEGGSDAVEL